MIMRQVSESCQKGLSIRKGPEYDLLLCCCHEYRKSPEIMVQTDFADIRFLLMDGKWIQKK